MKIAVLGTGRFATDFSPALVAAGHAVRFGSRSPREDPGRPGPVLSMADAVAGADLVLNALPGEAALEALPALRTALGSKVLIDVSNAFTEAGALRYPNSSVGEQLQALLPDTRVVKTLSTMAGYVAAEPSSLGAATTVFLSGDDDEAKAIVGTLLESLGWSADSRIDLGGISTSRAVEHLGLLFWALVAKYGTGEFNYRLVGP